MEGFNSDRILRIPGREITYGQAKTMLYTELIPKEGNEDILSTHPHLNIFDLAVLYRILLDFDGRKQQSLRISYSILNIFGVSEEQLMKDAIENAPNINPAVIRPMKEVLSEEGVEKCFLEIPDVLYIATTKNKIRGAGVLVYPNILQSSSEIIGGNFFILPSSIHELLFLKDDGLFKAEELLDIIKEVNASKVAPAEQLSDNVYYYNAKTRTFGAEIVGKITNTMSFHASLEKMPNNR